MSDFDLRPANNFGALNETELSYSASMACQWALHHFNEAEESRRGRLEKAAMPAHNLGGTKSGNKKGTRYSLSAHAGTSTPEEQKKQCIAELRKYAKALLLFSKYFRSVGFPPRGTDSMARRWMYHQMNICLGQFIMYATANEHADPKNEVMIPVCALTLEPHPSIAKAPIMSELVALAGSDQGLCSDCLSGTNFHRRLLSGDGSRYDAAGWVRQQEHLFTENLVKPYLSNYEKQAKVVYDGWFFNAVAGLAWKSILANGSTIRGDSNNALLGIVWDLEVKLRRWLLHQIQARAEGQKFTGKADFEIFLTMPGPDPLVGTPPQTDNRFPDLPDWLRAANTGCIHNQVLRCVASSNVFACGMLPRTSPVIHVAVFGLHFAVIEKAKFAHQEIAHSSTWLQVTPGRGELRVPKLKKRALFPVFQQSVGVLAGKFAGHSKRNWVRKDSEAPPMFSGLQHLVTASRKHDLKNFSRAGKNSKK